MRLGRGVDVTAARRLVGRILSVVALGFVPLALPLPLPLPTPPVTLPAGLPSPSLPVAVPTPALPSLVTPGQPATTPATESSGGTSRSEGAAAAGSSNPGRGITIPFTTISVTSPLDIALLAALASLPLLLGIWLLLFGRTFAEARRAREAQVRLALAADLGLRPKDLASTSTKALFQLRERSTFDELTGVMRRAAGISLADREIARARRHKSTLAVVFVDIDGLRKVNEQRGRDTGDATLQGMAKALKDGLREEDAVIRYGGDEFVCVLPDISEKAARATLGEVQVAAAKAGIRFGLGVAELRRADDVVSLLARADQDLYEFKTSRGEIVELAAPRRKRTPRGEPRSLTSS